MVQHEKVGILLDIYEILWRCTKYRLCMTCITIMCCLYFLPNLTVHLIKCAHFFHRHKLEFQYLYHHYFKRMCKERMHYTLRVFVYPTTSSVCMPSNLPRSIYFSTGSQDVLESWTCSVSKDKWESVCKEMLYSAWSLYKPFRAIRYSWKAQKLGVSTRKIERQDSFESLEDWVYWSKIS